MALRTTIEKVKSIMATALTDPEISLLISQANVIVTRKVGSEGLDTDLLIDLETWMTAHLIAIGKERQLYSEKVDDIWLTYQKNPEGFFTSTTFGQMILFLDTTGKFQQASKNKVTFNAIKQIQE